MRNDDCLTSYLDSVVFLLFIFFRTFVKNLIKNRTRFPTSVVLSIKKQI